MRERHADTQTHRHTDANSPGVDKFTAGLDDDLVARLDLSLHALLHLSHLEHVLVSQLLYDPITFSRSVINEYICFVQLAAHNSQPFPVCDHVFVLHALGAFRHIGHLSRAQRGAEHIPVSGGGISGGSGGVWG